MFRSLQHGHARHPLLASKRRTGRGNVLWVLVVCALSIISLSVALLSRSTSPSTGTQDTLTMYTAAGMRMAVEKIAEQYEQEYGTHIELQYGGST